MTDEGITTEISRFYEMGPESRYLPRLTRFSKAGEAKSSESTSVSKLGFLF
jgi:hypothetical protein